MHIDGPTFSTLQQIFTYEMQSFQLESTHSGIARRGRKISTSRFRNGFNLVTQIRFVDKHKATCFKKVISVLYIANINNET